MNKYVFYLNMEDLSLQLQLCYSIIIPVCWFIVPSSGH